MKPPDVFDETQAALRDYYLQQLEAALTTYALIDTLLDDSALPEHIRAQTRSRKGTAAILVAETIAEWQRHGGKIELTPALVPFASLIAPAAEPALVPEPAPAPSEPVQVPVLPPVIAVPTLARPPVPLVATPASMAQAAEHTPDRHIIVVEGDGWKIGCRERLAHLKGTDAAIFLQTARDWPFLDSLPTEVCHTFLEYLVASARRFRGVEAWIQVIRTVERYLGRHRMMDFVYGIAARHGRKSRDGEWALRVKQSLESLEEDLSDVPPERKNRERLLADLEKLLATPQVTGKDIADLVDHLLVAGVAADHTRLVNLLLPHLDALADRRTLKGVRRNVRKKMAEEQAAESEEMAPDAIPADWPWLEYTMDRNAIIYGGIPVPGHAERIRDAFGFQSVIWEDAEHSSRAFDPVHKRIKSGTCDFVIVLTRFVSHRAEDLLDVAKARKAPGIRVQHGYGISRLKLAIEETLQIPTTSAA